MDILQVQIKHAGYASNKKAVENINFSLKKGELAGLIGPNGAGKSTTIKAILGLLPEMEGEVKPAGQKARYAYIPENPVFYDELTLWEHLELAAAAYGMAECEFLAESGKLLEIFRLQKERHHLPGSFSKGMQQKVMLIIGFLIKADIYIVDEPFIGLDPRATRDFLSLLKEESKRGAGVLMSTHVLDTAEKICDSFVLLADGKLVAQGNLAQIREICRMPGAALFDCFNKILENLA
ncbi:ABC transporter ATP-binding protein [Pelotomaculum terephthalicicum JT]|uniref:ABC transporter ATP-binding protein n=1 Tax=Pelotomaculum TaxID=191373 RepID=UPI0009C7D53E|nr:MULTISPECIES: ABC transporter ATP-binding protein [Pelotomaculum]MCG9968929.1 ABC transporter ATP-binding protein [Pelotomaculum terephthalicicum JT]OPX86844.1 MAG: ABC-type transporter ATP-binding protein EcsA [Pelotomaculum sp. PtaB.Bin117]